MRLSPFLMNLRVVVFPSDFPFTFGRSKWRRIFLVGSWLHVLLERFIIRLIKVHECGGRNTFICRGRCRRPRNFGGVQCWCWRPCRFEPFPPTDGILLQEGRFSLLIRECISGVMIRQSLCSLTALGTFACVRWRATART
jgi:hypothetical protein